MKVLKTISVILFFVACSLSPPAFAVGNDFPGKGSIEDWKRSQAEYDLAHKLKESGNIVGAVDHFKKAIGIYPYDDKYYSSRADCFRKLGENLNARNDCSKAIVLKNEPVYWIMIADIAADQGDFLTCRKAANTAIGAGDKSVASLGNALSIKWSRMASAKGLSFPNTTAKMSVADLGVGGAAPASSYVPPPIESPRAPKKAEYSPFDKMNSSMTPPRRIIGRPAADSPEANMYIPPFLDKNRSR
ncbi:MAG: tetratricopeptide repeat protein [Candidatus Obscuribacterales bacterium]|nr:tetratricopeptide repeat protein [Candidatus Obscuribacterales bacterium]